MTSTGQHAYEGTDRAAARNLDSADPLGHLRQKFHIPKQKSGADVPYFCGNSLGLQPKGAQEIIESELEAWAKTGVEGHFKEERPWYDYHEFARAGLAKVVGAKPSEVVCMNSTTVNLHLMMVSFYRPSGARTKLLIEHPAFPSDMYAVQSQIRCAGHDPKQHLVTVAPREGEHTIRSEDILEQIERHGKELALVMIGGVNFVTGQLFDMPKIVQAARRAGCMVGFDLAHAAGNVPLTLHDWDVDFAVWCGYKYLNGGPGCLAGCFVNERHCQNRELPRFAGWWGNDPATRFKMHLQAEFQPVASADAWQLSNPPIFSLAPLLASLEIFTSVSAAALRAKSELLTGYLEYLLEQRTGNRYEIITPRDPAWRGCQLSIVAKTNPERVFQSLKDAEIIADFRPPNVIRMAPVPLYNSFEDVWRLVDVLAS